MLYLSLCLPGDLLTDWLLVLGTDDVLLIENSVGASESSSDSEASPNTMPQTTRFEVSIWRSDHKGQNMTVLCLLTGCCFRATGCCQIIHEVKSIVA